MKLILATALVAALSANVCLADPKADVQAAVAKLGAAANYSWTASTEFEGSNFPSVPVTGKTEKGGCAMICQERDGNVTMAIRKGEQGVVKTDAGWQTSEELRSAAQGGGGGGGRGGFRGGMLLRSRTPAEEAESVIKNVAALQESGGVISGDLTPAGAKEMFTFGRGRPGGQAPEAKNTKGSVKFWLKDGQLSKMQLRVSGTMTTRNGDERDMTRVTTYEIKDIGTTKMDIPADAKKKLGA